MSVVHEGFSAPDDPSFMPRKRKRKVRELEEDEDYFSKDAQRSWSKECRRLWADAERKNDEVCELIRQIPGKWDGIQLKSVLDKKYVEVVHLRELFIQAYERDHGVTALNDQVDDFAPDVHRHGTVKGLTREHPEDFLASSNQPNEVPGVTLHKVSSPEHASLSSTAKFQTANDLLPKALENEDIITLTPDQIKASWQYFRANVDPVTKIVPLPIFLDEMSKTNWRIEGVAKNLKPLVFGILACAIMSMTSSDCSSTLSLPKHETLKYVQTACQKALAELNFQSSKSIHVLQGFVLLLTSKLLTTEARAMWAQIGVAVRLAHFQGLHQDKDNGAPSALEVEYRRRLWWYINVLDARAAVLAGFIVPPNLPTSNTSLPLNIDDTQLHPDLQLQDPPTTPRATDMIFVLARYETMRSRQHFAHTVAAAGKDSTPRTTHTASATDAHITQLERTLEDRYFRFCDPAEPLHILTTTFSRAFICKMRHIASHEKFVAEGPQTPASKSQILAQNIKILEYAVLLQNSQATRGLMWYVDYKFPFGALSHLLRGLASMLQEDETSERACAFFEEWFAYRLDAEGEFTHRLHDEGEFGGGKWFNTICDGALAAWGTRRARLVARGRGDVEWEPRFIKRLEARWQTLHGYRGSRRSQGVGDGRNVDAWGATVNDFGWDASYVPSFDDWDLRALDLT
ncbi:MAG: hypothetical protein M1828_005697 [Chrysothrix sp. TS-e1954]|nr:MAG: hypothetical protein M1828_005697 [Chrysothrix sp. TS-e1954]